MLVLLFVALLFILRGDLFCLTLCHFVLVFFSPFSIAITSLGEERTNLGSFRTFVRFLLVWICRFSLPLGVWEGLRFVIVTLPGLFSYHFYSCSLIGIFRVLSTLAINILSYVNENLDLFYQRMPTNLFKVVRSI